MSDTDLLARTALAERFSRMLRSRLGARAVDVACAQEEAADGQAKVAWAMIVEVLKRD